jgi:hypothetical protein
LNQELCGSQGNVNRGVYQHTLDSINKTIVLPVRNKNKQILSWISGFKDSNGDTRIESWVDIELIVL